MGLAESGFDGCHVFENGFERRRQRPKFAEACGLDGTGCFPEGRERHKERFADPKAREDLPRENSAQHRDVLPAPSPSDRAAAQRAEERSGVADAWLRDLAAGVEVSVDGERVLLSYDRDLACLEVREHEALFPIAELRGCDAPVGEAEESKASLRNMLQEEAAAPFELAVRFAEMGDIALQFDSRVLRDGFREALLRLAHDTKCTAAGEPTGREESDGDEEGCDEVPLLLVGGARGAPVPSVTVGATEVKGYGEPDGGPWPAA